MWFGREEGVQERRAALGAVLGFACNQGFIFSLFYMGANRSMEAGSLAFERADLFGTLLFIVLAFAVLRIASGKARASMLAQPLLWAYAALMIVGSFLPWLLGDAGAFGLVVESALIGMPAGLLLAAWGQALGARTPRRCVPEVFVASAIGAAVCLVFALIPTPQALLLLKLLPIGSVLALGLLRRPAAMQAVKALGAQPDSGAGTSHEEAARAGSSSSSLSLGDLFATPEQRAETAHLSRKIVTGTVLFGLASGFMETYGSDPGMASTPTFPATLLLFVLFCIAALQLLATEDLVGAARGAGAVGGAANASAVEVAAGAPREKEGPLDGVYRLAMLVMMAGFLFVPVLSEFGVSGEAIELAGYLGLTYVLVSLFLVMARLTGQDAAVSFARGFSALFLGEMAGIVLGNGVDMLAPSGQTPYAVVACAGLAALFSYLFLFTERDFRALSVIARDVDRFDEACKTLAETYGLSKRESEILPLALRGRTGERIAAEFYISKSTVDTHLRRIYSKTGVHNRQELIDLGERTAKDMVPK